MIIDPEIVKRSVTREDHQGVSAGGVVQFLVPQNPNYRMGSLPSLPPPYWSPMRDDVLRATVLYESMWASAVGIAIAKMVSNGWGVNGNAPTLIKRSHEIIRGMDWYPTLSKHLRDFLTTDNGGFLEIVHASRAAGSRILGLVHLDSRRITRTGDIEIPAVYRDKMGREHLMRAHQIIMLSDMPDPSETYNGVGLSAASRAYRHIYKLASMEQYVTEKVSGDRALAVYFISGVSETTILSAMTTADEEMNRKGATLYKGAVTVPVLGDVPPQVAKIPLAELPDGFQRKEEFDISILGYANAIGLDVQDLQPLTGRPLGTGMQSQVLDDKASGKGLAAWRQGFTKALNEWVLPDRVAFYFYENDYRDQIQKASLSNARIDYIGKWVALTAITPAQALQIGVDQDELPQEFLAADLTARLQLTDTDKPEMVAEQQEQGRIMAEETARIEAEEAAANAELQAQLAFQQGMTAADAAAQGAPADVQQALIAMGPNPNVPQGPAGPEAGAAPVVETQSTDDYVPSVPHSIPPSQRIRQLEEAVRVLGGPQEVNDGFWNPDAEPFTADELLTSELDGAARIAISLLELAKAEGYE